MAKLTRVKETKLTPEEREKRRVHLEMKHRRWIRAACKRTGKRWIHVGGGTLLIGKSRFPSDDTFESAAGNYFTVRCTTDRHFNMPHAVNSSSEITRLSGVSRAVKRGRCFREPAFG